MFDPKVYTMDKLNEKLVKTVLESNFVQFDAERKLEKNPRKIKELKNQTYDPETQNKMIYLMEQNKKTQPFELITNIEDITKRQYITFLMFEKFYKSRQNEGLRSIEKNMDIQLAKNLFKIWDQDRMGWINVD